MGTNNSETAKLRVRGFALGPHQTNCYVVRVGEAPGCWLVDAGFQPGEMIRFLEREGVRPEAVILTHAHADHIAGLREALAAFPGTPVWMHEAERDWLADPRLNLSSAMGLAVTAPGPDATLTHGQRLELAGTVWIVLHTPGHSPGGITLYCEEAGAALVGDALFAGSIGRADLPGSSFEVLERSIQQHLYSLPEETRVFPGHGPTTTIGREKLSNPFVRCVPSQ